MPSPTACSAQDCHCARANAHPHMRRARADAPTRAHAHAREIGAESPKSECAQTRVPSAPRARTPTRAARTPEHARGRTRARTPKSRKSVAPPEGRRPFLRERKRDAEGRQGLGQGNWDSSPEEWVFWHFFSPSLFFNRYKGDTKNLKTKLSLS